MKLLKKISLIFLCLCSVIVLGFFILIKSSGDRTYDKSLKKIIVNDVTQANPIQMSKVITPKTIEEIIAAVKESTGPVSIGGGRYSMGGQTALPGGPQIDMRNFDRVISFSKLEKTITVQAGITWRKIQEVIDLHNLSVKIMQTYSNFTVGGSLSVNVHGRYLGKGPLILSVKSIKVVLANGELVTASPLINKDVFYAAIGGYGGIGIIVEATLFLDENVKVERMIKRLKISEFKDYFFKEVRNRQEIVFFNADIIPDNYEDLTIVNWYKTDKEVTISEKMIPQNREYFWLPKLTQFISSVPFGAAIRKNILEPIYYAEDRIVWRNWEASYDVNELESGDRSEYTYVLQEYFIPVEKFDEFYPKMKKVFNQRKVDVINVSIRHAFKDPGSILAWARSEVFAFVIYYKQALDKTSREEVKKWTIEMTDQILSVGGTYYLPYQIHATLDQFHRSYPHANKYFELKKKYDPQARFQNQLLRAYSPSLTSAILRDLNNLKDYQKGEEQTYLTLPEWYLVFNPQDYVNFLKSKKNPSDFPFFASINEYWAYYDRVLKLVKDQYPTNDEYLTMLQIIGVSTTVEYSIKGVYENSIGRLTRFFAGGEETEEDELIKNAQNAYVQYIYDEPWYKFSFSPWVKKIWSETSFFGAHFIRKMERKIFFTTEFLFKGFYGSLLKMGAENSYAPPVTEVYLWVKIDGHHGHQDKNDNKANSLQVDPRVQIYKKYDDHNFIIKIPRWKGFSEIVPKLARANVQFVEIAGNDDIALSVISDKDSINKINKDLLLFESAVFGDENKRRLALTTKTTDLTTLLNQLDNEKIIVEHIYDY